MKKFLVFFLFICILCCAFTGCSSVESKEYPVFPNTDWGMLPNEVFTAINISTTELDKDNHIVIEKFTLLGHSGKLRLIFDDFGGMMKQSRFTSAFFETDEVITNAEVEQMVKRQAAHVTYDKQVDYSRWYSNATISELTDEQEFVMRSFTPATRLGGTAAQGEWTAFCDESKLAEIYLDKSEKSLNFNGGYAAIYNHFDEVAEYQWQPTFIPSEKE